MLLWLDVSVIDFLSRRLEEILRELQRASLIRCDQQTATISIHRLVQASFRSQMSKEQLFESFQLASAFILQRLPVRIYVANEESELPKVYLLLPHIQALIRNAEEVPTLKAGQDFVALVARAHSWEL